MELEIALKLHLQNYAALRAIHNGNVCPGIAPETWKAPYQTFFFISDSAENRQLGVPMPHVQINNFAPSYSQARLMFKLTYEAIAGFSGIMGGPGGVMVETGIYVDSQDMYEDDTKLYNCMVDMKLVYRD